MLQTYYHQFAKTCGPVVKVGAAVEPGAETVGRILVKCMTNTWSPYSVIPETAPTQHDNEDTAARRCSSRRTACGSMTASQTWMASRMPRSR